MKLDHDLQHHIDDVLFQQVNPLGVISKELKTVLKKINRYNFLPPAQRDFAYADAPILLKRRCELPFFVLALLIEALKLPLHTKVDHITIVSVGTGYSASIFSHFAKTVEAFEPDSILFARLIEASRNHPNIDPVTMLSDHQSDFIFFDGGAHDVIPEAVIQKLNPSGRLAIIMPILSENEPKISGIQPIHPTHTHMVHPLCQGIIFEKNGDAIQPMQENVLQIHIPILQNEQNKKVLFNF